MRDFRDSKAMAQTLREILKTKSVALTQSESLELVARLQGFQDWNVLAAKIQSSQTAGAGPVRLPIEAPTYLPIIAMRDVVFFPQMVTPIFIARDKSRRAAENALARDGILLVVTQKQAADDDPALDQLHRVGVTARVISRATLPDGSLKLFVSCLERKLVGHAASTDFLAAEALPFEESRMQADEAAVLSHAVLEAYRTYADRRRNRDGFFHVPSIGGAGMIADTVAPYLSIGIDRRQQLLETADVVARLEAILAAITESQQAA